MKTEKSDFRIGELAELYGIGTDTIRYYEEQGLIAPRRGENGYRLYSIRDIWRMNVIRDLRALGFPLERIRAYLNDRSVESTLGLLREEREAVDRRIAELEALRSNVDARMDTLRRAGTSPLGVAERVELPLRRCHQIEEAFTTDEEVDLLMKRLLNRDRRRLYLIGSNRIGCRVPQAAIEAGRYRAYSAAFLIDEEGPLELAAGSYMRLLYHGDTRQNEIYVPRLLEAMRQAGMHPAGDLLELIWVDIHEAADINEHLTELQLRCEAAE